MNLIIIFIFGVVVGGVVIWMIVKKKKENKQGNESFNERQRKKKEENKKRVLEFLGSRERVTNDEIEKLFDISNATAERYLDELEKEGFIRQVGRTGRSVYYKLLNTSTG